MKKSEILSFRCDKRTRFLIEELIKIENGRLAKEGRLFHSKKVSQGFVIAAAIAYHHQAIRAAQKSQTSLLDVIENNSK